MKKAKLLLSIAGLLFFTAAVLSVGQFIGNRTNVTQKAAAGTKLSISPATQNITKGQDLFFTVLMDTDANRVTGLDLQLNFNPDMIQISSLKKGAGVENLNNTISNNFDNNAGQVMYAIFTLDKNNAVQGTDLEVLQIRAKVAGNAAPGSFTVTFDPSTAVSATSQSQNVLVSTSPATFTLTAVTPSPVPTDMPTTVPTATATSTPYAGEPNSCGGTCGSNFNCGANLFCYQGYCRNPSCSWSDDCSCDATPEPTTAPTRSPRLSNNTNITPRPTTEPTVVEFTPEPEPEATETPNDFWGNIFDQPDVNGPAETPDLEPIDIPESENTNYLPWIIGSLIIAGVTLIFIVIGILKEAGYKKNKPPIIKV